MFQLKNLLKFWSGVCTKIVSLRSIHRFICLHLRSFKKSLLEFFFSFKLCGSQCGWFFRSSSVGNVLRYGREKGGVEIKVEHILEISYLLMENMKLRTLWNEAKMSNAPTLQVSCITMKYAFFHVICNFSFVSTNSSNCRFFAFHYFNVLFVSLLVKYTFFTFFVVRDSCLNNYFWRIVTIVTCPANEQRTAYLLLAQ